jgi:signal transduction histidine kinase
LVTLQRELAKKNAELERLNRQKNEFLGMAAHDLRSPLGVIWSYSEFLLNEISDQLNDEHLEFLSIVKQSSEFMLNLVDDLLDVSAIESGKLQLNLEPTDLTALVEHNVTLHRILAEKKQIHLTLYCEGDLPNIQLDPAKIQQVLDNLITNAVKYSFPARSVEIRVDRRGEEALISVRDEGPGIPADELDSLFTWFGTTSVKATDGEKSIGLGLAIVRKIVRGHRGRIWVESEVNQGTTFYVSLPL